MTTRERTVGRYLRWFLAALALGAGVIHFAYSGDHYEMSWRHGTFFAVVAWLQISYAVVVVLRPTCTLLIAGVVLNAAIIAVWAVSRVWGVPIGPDAWTPEPVGWADGLSTLFEGLIVATSLAVLVRPAIAGAQLRPSFGIPAVAVPVLAVAVMSSLALSPALASGHSHAGGDEAMGGHSHGVEQLATGGAAAGHAGGHTNVVIQADGTSRCEKAGYANQGNSGHGHRGPVPYTELTAEERPLFRDQVAGANQVIVTYPTVADAEAAGWKRITPYVPCIAAHYLKSSAFRNGFDPLEPEILLFEGTDPTSKIVGLSYLQFSDGQPDGFAGPNDPWHIHKSLCIGGGGGVVGDESTTDAECEARGGKNLNLENLWMNHMWNVPGWDSRWSASSAIHPNQVKAARDRFRVAAGKTDAFDSFVLCELARTDAHRFHALAPCGDETAALRALVRTREDPAAARVALANQLRAQLDCFCRAPAGSSPTSTARSAWRSPSAVAALPTHADSAPSAASFPRATPTAADAPPTNCCNACAAHPSPSSASSRPTPAAAACSASSARCARSSSRSVSSQARSPAPSAHTPTDRPSARCSAIPRARSAPPACSPKSATTGRATPPATASPRTPHGTRRDRFGQTPQRCVSLGLRQAPARPRLRPRRQHSPLAPLGPRAYQRARERGCDHPDAIRILGRAWTRVLGAAGKTTSLRPDEAPSGNAPLHGEGLNRALHADSLGSPSTRAAPPGAVVGGEMAVFPARGRRKRHQDVLRRLPVRRPKRVPRS